MSQPTSEPRVEILPNGATRLHFGPPSDRCPICGGSGSCPSYFSMGPNYSEAGPGVRCAVCNGTGKR